MNVNTSVGVPLSAGLLEHYFQNLVNQVYKILPMRENGTESLGKYIWRLEAELIGGQGLIDAVKEDAYYGSLLNILQYLSDYGDHCSNEQVKQLVFEGISLCEKLRKRYTEAGDRDERLGSVSGQV